MLVRISDVFWVDPSQVSAVYLAGTGHTVIKFLDGEAIPIEPDDVVADVVRYLNKTEEY